MMPICAVSWKSEQKKNVYCIEILVADMYQLIRVSNFVVISLVLLFNSLSANGIFQKADSLYNQCVYDEALYYYQQLANTDRFFREDFVLNFKIAMCYLYGEAYQKSEIIFKKLRQQQNEMPEYLEYFYFRSLLGQNKTAMIRDVAYAFLEKYQHHYLADSLRLKLADYEFSIRNYRSAEMHYTQLSRNKKYKDLRSYLEAQVAYCKMNTGQEFESVDRMYQIIKKYPGSDEARKIAGYFYSNEPLRDKYFFVIADVFLEHRHFTELTENIENYIKGSNDKGEKERARFYLLKVYFARGDFQKALYGFKNMLASLGNPMLESHLRLMIARTLLSLDDKKGAANAYLEYSDKYPRRRVAVDAAWKAAWLFEELGEVSSALAQYQRITEHWSGSRYWQEAKFRMGLSYYRLEAYARAEDVFRSIINSRRDNFHRERASYWLAKVYNRINRQAEAEKIYLTLSQNLFEGYYAIKSYLQVNSSIDQIVASHGKLRHKENPLRQYSQSLANVMDNFARLFIIQDLLGDSYAHEELEEKKYRATTLGEWIALAEVYKRLEAYHRAYRVYDYINGKYFADLPNEEKPFLLKESYPLYYDNIIDRYCKLRFLDKNMILAIIRAESGYDRHAHSWANAYGLMQLIPPTANAVADEINLNLTSIKMLFDAELNINLGTYYFKKLLDQFDNRVEYALAAYNAGPHRVNRWQNITPDDEIDLFVENIEFSQTRNYVRKVMRNYWIYTFLDKIN